MDSVPYEWVCQVCRCYIGTDSWYALRDEILTHRTICSVPDADRWQPTSKDREFLLAAQIDPN